MNRELTSKIGLGCWGLGGDAYGTISESNAKETILTALNCGITFFDTSPIYGYGKSELLLGKYLPKNSEIKVATKVGMAPHSGTEIPYSFADKDLRISIEESLKRLDSESLEIVQLHSPKLNYKEEFPGVLDSMKALTQEGKVKKWGISLGKPQYLEYLLFDYPWESVQFNFSLIDQRIAQFSRLLKEQSTTFIARTPLNFGFLSNNPISVSKFKDPLNHISKWPREQLENWSRAAEKMRGLAKDIGRGLDEMAIRFILDSGFADFVIPGATNPLQVKSNISAQNSPRLSESEIERIKLVYQNIEEELKITSPYKYTDNK